MRRDDDGARRSRGRGARRGAGLVGPERAAQGGPPARAGPGRLRRRHQAARHGLHPLRALAVRARPHHLDRRLEGHLAEGRLRDDDGRGGRVAHRSVLPALDAARARTSRTTRSPSARCGTSARPSSRSSRPRRELARDASELVEVEYEPIDAVVDARHAQGEDVPVLHEDSGSNLMWEGVYEWGDLDAAFAEADKIVKISELHFHRFNSTPLETDGALVEFNRGVGQWTIHTNNQFPGFAAIMMGPAMRLRARQAPLRHAGHRRRLRQQDHVASAARRLLPAGPQARPAGAVDGVAHRLPHVDVARQRALVPRHRGRRQERRDDARLPDEGARRRRCVASLRAARRRHLGAGRARHVPLAQHPARVHAGRDEQGARARRTAATRACSSSGSPSA